MTGITQSHDLIAVQSRPGDSEPGPVALIPRILRRLSRKICLLGDADVGLTSLLERFVHDSFEEGPSIALGVRVCRKTVVVPCGHGLVEVSMLVWDHAGGDQIDQLRGSYYRGAAGAVLACDLTRPETLRSLVRHAADFRAARPTASLVVAANKADLTDRRQVAEEHVAALATNAGAPWYLTSAKTGTDVETLFRHLGSLVAAGDRAC